MTEPLQEPPSLDDFAAMADQALATVPAALAAHMDNVGFVIQDWPDAATLQRLGIRHPLGLLGLYSGTPLIARSVTQPARMPDRIFLFRQPILNQARRTGADLAQLVRHVLIHEIAHHFGYSDEGIAALDARPD
ncbi:MAG: metallopeptidase family protein [Proteobacteria bacterium]|nr:metallopeptidase family protein [Pseudomonadota bacterium]